MNGMEEQARPGIASSDEDPNASVVGSSPPCFLHELDPSYLGYLRTDEVRELLDTLLAAQWQGTVLESAWLRAMLRRHLASLGTLRPRGPWRTDDEAQPGSTSSSKAGAGRRDLACMLRDTLPRLWDEAMRRDLAEVLRMMERDQQQRPNRPGSV